MNIWLPKIHLHFMNWTHTLKNISLTLIKMSFTLLALQYQHTAYSQKKELQIIREYSVEQKGKDTMKVAYISTDLAQLF